MKLYLDMMTNVKDQLQNIDINSIRWYMFQPSCKMILLTGDVFDPTVDVEKMPESDKLLY